MTDKKCNELENDVELNANDLENVSGRFIREIFKKRSTIADKIRSDIMPAGSDPAAYCMSCGEKLDFVGQRRIAGGLTDLFICRTSGCSEYGVEKNNLEVNWNK
ncbi:MAG: hypothetical protein IJM44_02505 [Ruminococcus sp.]|nr:hypothetical protein [Ruminococcus sp.]